MSLLVLFDPRLQLGVAHRKKLFQNQTTKIEKWNFDISLSGIDDNHTQNIAYDTNMSVFAEDAGKKYRDDSEDTIIVEFNNIKVRTEDE